MASFRAVRRALCTAAEATPAPAPAPAPVGRWERLKQSKAGVWCRSLLSDYKEACREVVAGARERPLKASVYLGLLGGAYVCFSTKPDQSSFQAALLDRSNQLALLSPWIRNGASDLHVQNLVKLWNEGRLHHLSLGLFSLVYSADFDPQSALYEAACPDLSVPWRALPGRVLDVGFVGRWWVLDKKMEDFDVNEAEYKHLPPHMQATAPPGVQEVERNEKLHKDSWLPITVHEEEETAERTGERTEERPEETAVRTEDTPEETAVRTEDTPEETAAERTEEAPEETTAERTEDTPEETLLETENLKMDYVYVAQADTAAITEVDTQTAQTPDIKEEDTIEDGLGVEPLDTKDKTHEDTQTAETLDMKEEVKDLIEDSLVVETLDTEALETVDVKEEAVETRRDREEDVRGVEAVDTVAMEMVDTPEDSVSEEDVKQNAEQSMKN